MEGLERVKVLFIAAFGPIVRDVAACGKLYGSVVSFPSRKRTAATFIQKLYKAQEALLCGRSLTRLRPVLVLSHGPMAFQFLRAWLEFDVDNVTTATTELEAQGYRMLVRNKTEAWGPTVSRFLDPNGLLVGLTFTSWMREQQ